MSYKCDKCGKEFETKKEAERHERNCDENLDLIHKIQTQIIKNKNVAIISSCILGFLFLVIFVINPEPMKELLSSILGLIFFILICYFCAKLCGRKQTQSQSQHIVFNSGDKKRVCSECGLQNDVDNVFCSDCGKRLKKKSKKKTK